MDYNKILKLRQKYKYPLLKVKPGYYLEIYEKVGEGDKQRIWKFRGLVIKVKKPNNFDGTFTIRGEVAGVKVEKIYPLSFQNFEKVILLDEYKIRRAKLYFMRYKIGKAAKLKSIIKSEDKGRDLWKEAVERLEEELKEIEKKLGLDKKEEQKNINEDNEVEKSVDEVEKNAEEAVSKEKSENLDVESNEEKEGNKKVEEKVEVSKEDDVEDKSSVESEDKEEKSSDETEDESNKEEEEKKEANSKSQEND